MCFCCGLMDSWVLCPQYLEEQIGEAGACKGFNASLRAARGPDAIIQRPDVIKTAFYALPRCSGIGPVLPECQPPASPFPSWPFSQDKVCTRSQLLNSGKLFFL
ncbi:hypothetical protein lerEdw1_003989 [Lerista edwardsae]|nr:hypothetical protein lerEdw1_003989 [Lerista edwardsae]